MTTYGDNAFAPGMTSDAYTPDQLVAGHLNLVTDSVTLTGAAALVRGSVLGVTISAATAVAAAGTNTGNGVMGAVTASGIVQEGIYILRITKAVTNAGDFEIIDPRGIVVGLGSVATAFNQGGLAFTLADGSADYVPGDTFLITVSAPTAKYKLSTSAATDGSQIAEAILADAADPSSADVTVGIYKMGEFNQRALTLGAGQTLTAVKAQLGRRGIFLKNAVSAADPT